WLCDYGRFSHERYDTDRVVVPKVRTDDDYLAISTWSEALAAIETAFEKTRSIAVIASSNMTNEEALMAKRLFNDQLGAKTFDVMVDPIGSIKMISRTEGLMGNQDAPNSRRGRAGI